MKIRQRKGIDKKLDDAWSELVKLKAGNKCEYCGADRKVKQLHSHHIYTRSNKAGRWNVSNGVALCAGHHVLSSSFSAHKTPVEFTRWLDKYKGIEFMDMLSFKVRQISKLHKFEKEILLNELKNEINENKERN